VSKPRRVVAAARDLCTQTAPLAPFEQKEAQSMRRVFQARVFRAAALVALLAAAAAAAAPERSSETVESHTFDHQTTEKKRHELRVPADDTRVRLRVKASVRQGELRIVVRDPDGRLFQEARLGPSKKTTNYDVDSDVMRSEAGVWTVEVEATGAVGSYEVAFKQYQ
jgi:hypothetical protein